MQATMYAFTCPFCQHTLQLADVNEGQIVTCTNPGCQKKFEANLPRVEPDMEENLREPELIIPGEFREAPATTPAEAVPEAVPAAAIVVTEGATKAPIEEERIVEVFPAPMVRRYPGYFVAYLGLIALGLWGIYNGWTYNYNGLVIMSLVPAAFGLWRLVYWYLSVAGASVTITTKNVVVRAGFMTGVLHEINHKSITKIHIFQPWFCRLLHTGSVMLVWGESDETVHIDSVLHPHTLTNLIRQYATNPAPAPVANVAQ